MTRSSEVGSDGYGYFISPNATEVGAVNPGYVTLTQACSERLPVFLVNYIFIYLFGFY